MNKESSQSQKNMLFFWNWPLFVQILAGMAAGIAFGFLASNMGWQDFTKNWVAPFGKIFVNSLKMIAIPLIVASLIKGISEVRDISKLSAMGGKTVLFYVTTTVIAITVGLVLVNAIGPGRGLPDDVRENLLKKVTDTEQASEDGKGKDAEMEKTMKAIKNAKSQKEKGPLQPLVDLVPSNIISAATSNGNMLQVIFFTVLLGVGLLLVRPEESEPVRAFFFGLNEVILKIIDMIMLYAPIGVFALLANLVASTTDVSVFKALGWYSLTVVLGLSIMILIVYPAFVYFFTGRGPLFLLKGIFPAQLLAFSTSSSAATLPVTMERVTEHMGVDDEVASFVLPVGATVNMDGTSLYQAVAAVFIAQVLGHDLSLINQLQIVITATLASIGSAAVPGAGMVMLVIVLSTIGLPSEGLALIVAVDRLLDMCRTTVNVTGDASVATIIAGSVGKLHEPHVKNLDDKFVEQQKY